MRAYEHWERVANLDSQIAWLQRVAANLAVSWRRRQRARLVLCRETVSFEDSPIQEPTVIRALRTLTPAQRTVVVLRFFADQSVRQVSEALGKRPGTVRALTHQGLTRLRETIDKEVLQR